ncbi:MAG: zinc-dependent alcohol dehydrogenase family protein [Thermoguttaceae bacterium]|jgi:propanol-preferring alcohol dehydrogenase
MQAMLLEQAAPIASSPLRLVDLPLPEPAASEVRLKVHCCGVCRTDLHVVEGDLPQEKMPVVPGHQVVGTVDGLGPGCRRFRPGQRIGVAWLRWTCGQCRFCTSGRENLCERARFTGYHADGGYAQYAVVHEDFAYEIPAAFGDVEAAPLLCAGIIGYRALLRSRLPPGGRLAMYGFGSSAHVLLPIARHRGCEVYVVTRDEKHRELARQMGAAWVGSRAEDMPVKADSAILFAPAGELVPPALEKLEKGGTLALAGIYMTPIPAMDYQRYVFYERDIHSVTSNTRQDGRELLAEAAAIPLRPHTTVYPLAEANRALADLKADRIAGTAVLVPER